MILNLNFLPEFKMYVQLVSIMFIVCFLKGPENHNGIILNDRYIWDIMEDKMARNESSGDVRNASQAGHALAKITQAMRLITGENKFLHHFIDHKYKTVHNLIKAFIICF